MALYAISDLHLAHEANRRAVERVLPHPDDWLVIAGDVGEKEDDLRFALEVFTARFRRVIWTPGNHDLWTLPSEQDGLRGAARYQRLVAVCHEYGVTTPEDPYPLWTQGGATYRIAPLFTLYDYSFRPDEIPAEAALDWALEADTLCSDEYLLHPDPYPDRSTWCHARCWYTEQRLAALPSDAPLVLVNHWPLRYDLARLPRVPRFSLWCGTKLTENWHLRFPVAVVIYGHLHLRGTHRRNGIRFEEVSLGYPRNWDQSYPLEHYLRPIFPRNG